MMDVLSAAAPLPGSIIITADCNIIPARVQVSHKITLDRLAGPLAATKLI
jgi:hypothetical protein